MKNKTSIDPKIEEVLKQYDAKDEDDFQHKMLDTWNIVRCVRCGKEIDLLSSSFYYGDPVCKKGTGCSG